MKLLIASVLTLLLSVNVYGQTASTNGTTVTPASGGSLTDSKGGVWTLGSTPVPITGANGDSDCAPVSCGNPIVLNGTAQSGTAAALLLYYNATIYQENAASQWWSWNGSSWTKAKGDPRPVTPPTPPTITCVPSSIQVGGASSCSSNQTIGTWAASSGTITSTGAYTAPQTPGTVKVTGMSGNGIGTAMITVTSAPIQTVPCTATYTAATGALAINCTLPTSLSAKSLRSIAPAVAPQRLPRHGVALGLEDKSAPRIDPGRPRENQNAEAKFSGIQLEARTHKRAVLEATAGHSVSLNWTASTDAGSAYNIYRLIGVCPTGSPTGFSLLGSSAATTYSDATVSPGSYCYYATATLNGNESVPSNLASAKVLPAAPTNFGCSASASGQTVGVTCTPTN